VLQYGICCRYYVTDEQCWRPEWVGVRYRAWTHISHVHCSLAQTAFMKKLRPTRRLPLDKQCRSAIIISTTFICHVTTVASDNWLSWCPLTFPTLPTDDHPQRRSPQRSVAWVVIQGGWWRILILMSLHAAYYILQNGYRQFADADVLACSDVAVFRCLMCTSAELCMIHVTSSDGKPRTRITDLVAAVTNLCSYWFILSGATVSSFDRYLLCFNFW